jgi:hypothetical protein
MAFPTTSVYLVQNAGGWDPVHRRHPVIDFMTDYEEAFHSGSMKSSGTHAPWHTDDFNFTKPDLTTITNGPAAFAALLEMYAPFSASYHDPQYYVIWETATGYVLAGAAFIYSNFVVPGAEGKKEKDLGGREWDFKALGSFQFTYVKDPTGPKGLKLKAQSLVADGIPLAKELIKRKMATAEQILS